MTWGNPPKLIPTKPKKGKLIRPEDLAASNTEDGHQMAVFAWAADNCGQYPYLKWLYSIPNGGSRHVVEAGKMVAAGLRRGVWDIFLPLPIQTEWAKQYAGLYIEMKIEKRRKEKNGGLSDDQLAFGKYAQQMGYCCKVCYHWEEAANVLIYYMKGLV